MVMMMMMARARDLASLGESLQRRSAHDWNNRPSAATQATKARDNETPAAEQKQSVRDERGSPPPRTKAITQFLPGEKPNSHLKLRE
jgi:hypothetical protein